MEYIVCLSDKSMPEGNADERLGGKAASLMKMCEAGFPVPEGFVILADAWDDTGLKEQAKKDMASMLDYIDKLGELDTDGVEPMSHVFPVKNVFREDAVTNSDTRVELLSNAPEEKDGMFMVPRTID